MSTQLLCSDAAGCSKEVKALHLFFPTQYQTFSFVLLGEFGGFSRESSGFLK
jgi:hypothetical protein